MVVRQEINHMSSAEKASLVLFKWAPDKNLGELYYNHQYSTMFWTLLQCIKVMWFLHNFLLHVDTGNNITYIKQKHEQAITHYSSFVMCL